MKILITGITGFVGNQLYNYLSKLNYEITGLGREKRGNVNYTYSELDKLENVFFDFYIHLAGKAHDLRSVINDKEYYESNLELTQKIYKTFETSKSKSFIFMSSIKSLSDTSNIPLIESMNPIPKTIYGKSKLAAENFLLKNIKNNANLYILRPCLIYGVENKGNLKLLYDIINFGIPYPLGSFDNKRTFLSINNLCFVILGLIKDSKVPSGIYHISDSESLSTNELVALISKSIGKRAKILNLPKKFIKFIVKINDYLNLPLNSERLEKLTSSLVISNQKLLNTMKITLPETATKGLENTFRKIK